MVSVILGEDPLDSAAFYRKKSGALEFSSVQMKELSGVTSQECIISGCMRLTSPLGMSAKVIAQW